MLDPEGQEVISETHKLLCEPKDAAGLADPELRAAVTSLGPRSFEVRFRSSRVALFVYLDTSVSGRFSDNGFILWGGAKTVIFNATESSKTLSAPEFKKSLRVMSYFKGETP